MKCLQVFRSNYLFESYKVFKQKRKKDNFPKADERVIHNVFVFLNMHHILAILFIILL
ncbi:hypothetical protein [Virgibacillus proomii]|uniref:hypothetical protein n=1 Tax=Virgibacillus proomii TaxID=84407 RepID=UPI001C110EF1|nr:hypothetical protein [Virgibacillus proomii]MBU5267705.1 hypothetical protein [Virgibacillus proomii]